MPKKTKVLEELATKMVGDGKSPNLYFVSSDGAIVAITVDLDDANDIARNHTDVLIEDRKEGLIWESQS